MHLYSKGIVSYVLVAFNGLFNSVEITYCEHLAFKESEYSKVYERSIDSVETLIACCSWMAHIFNSETSSGLSVMGIKKMY